MTLVEYSITLLTNPFVSIPVVLIQFIILMKLKAKYGDDLIKPLVVLFIIQDWLVNVGFTVVFLDLPGKPFELVTGRMQRYKRAYAEPTSRRSFLGHWRYGFAMQLCRILNRYDMGHC